MLFTLLPRLEEVLLNRRWLLGALVPAAALVGRMGQAALGRLRLVTTAMRRGRVLEFPRVRCLVVLGLGLDFLRDQLEQLWVGLVELHGSRDDRVATPFSGADAVRFSRRRAAELFVHSLRLRRLV